MFAKPKKVAIFASAISNECTHTGEMAERSNAAVLKTVDCNRSGGSNPSFSAKGSFKRNFKAQEPIKSQCFIGFFVFGDMSNDTLNVKR